MGHYIDLLDVISFMSDGPSIEITPIDGAVVLLLLCPMGIMDPLCPMDTIRHLGISSVFNKNEISRPDSNPGLQIRRPTLNRCAIEA